MTTVATGFQCDCGKTHRPRLNDAELNVLVASLQHRVNMYERLGDTESGTGKIAADLLGSLTNMSPGFHSQRRAQQ